MSHDFRLYAHRGASAELPENTLPAFRRALEIGVDALEMDVHLTRDGHPLVSHDEHAGRMGGVKARWSELDLAEAQRVDLGQGFVAPDGGRPHVGKGFRAPTFEEVLVELPGVRVNVDIKQARPPMVSPLLRLIRKLKAEDRVTLASFQTRTLLAVRQRGYGGETALAQGAARGGTDGCDLRHGDGVNFVNFSGGSPDRATTRADGSFRRRRRCPLLADLTQARRER